MKIRLLFANLSFPQEKIKIVHQDPSKTMPFAKFALNSSLISSRFMKWREIRFFKFFSKVSRERGFSFLPNTARSISDLSVSSPREKLPKRMMAGGWWYWWSRNLMRPERYIFSKLKRRFLQTKVLCSRLAVTVVSNDPFVLVIIFSCASLSVAVIILGSESLVSRESSRRWNCLLGWSKKTSAIFWRVFFSII